MGISLNYKKADPAPAVTRCTLTIGWSGSIRATGTRPSFRLVSLATDTLEDGMADAGELIDKRIEELADWRGELLARIRRLVLGADPGIIEEWKWDSPVWSKSGMLASAGVFKGHVKVNFFRGASLPDPKGLFNAGLEAKTSRGIDVHEGDALDEAGLQELVRAAVVLNAQK